MQVLCCTLFSGIIDRDVCRISSCRSKVIRGIKRGSLETRLSLSVVTPVDSTVYVVINVGGYIHCVYN